MSQIYLNLTEISEDRQESLFEMKTRWKAFKTEYIHILTKQLELYQDFYQHYLYCFSRVYGILLFF